MEEEIAKILGKLWKRGRNTGLPSLRAVTLLQINNARSKSSISIPILVSLSGHSGPFSLSQTPDLGTWVVYKR